MMNYRCGFAKKTTRRPRNDPTIKGLGPTARGGQINAHLYS